MKLTESLETQIADFVKTSTNSKIKRGNRWFVDERMKLYIRLSVRRIKDEVIQTLDIASIEIDPRYQRQGLCKNTLKFCLSLELPVFIESVCNEHLKRYLENNKWQNLGNLCYLKNYEPTK